MGILITVLLVIAGIIGLLLLLALFVKKDYLVQRDIVISQPEVTCSAIYAC